MNSTGSEASAALKEDVNILQREYGISLKPAPEDKVDKDEKRMQDILVAYRLTGVTFFSTNEADEKDWAGYTTEDFPAAPKEVGIRFETFAQGDLPGDKRIVTPPMLGDKISLSLGHTSTFVFLGTKAEILEWFRTVGPSKIVQATVFNNRPPLDLVFDLFSVTNPDLTWAQYYYSFYKSDPTLERYRLEIRPEQTKIDSELEPLYRMYAKSGVCLGDMATALDKKWSQPPAKSYLDMAKELFMERDEATDHAQEVAAETKRVDEEGREVELEDIVVSAPVENRH
ncbi:hypothetical protein EDD11_001954 [Mortierella claussenii]|nr:hypothetical protein EDD11_001954 [Mortierella claussenii]